MGREALHQLPLRHDVLGALPALVRRRAGLLAFTTQFICFTRTKEQILTPEELDVRVCGRSCRSASAAPPSSSAPLVRRGAVRALRDDP